MKVEYITSGTNINHFPTTKLPEFVFFGRSNVGKSSFINAFTNHNIARTSSNPGKTQTLNFFLVDDNYYLVDVPGYGYAHVSKMKKEEFGQMLEHYIVNREVLKKAFLLIDFRHPPTDDDILMLNFLRYYEIPIVIIATKKDKVKRSLHKKHLNIIMEKLLIGEDDIIVTSAKTKEGFELVTKTINGEFK